MPSYKTLPQDRHEITKDIILDDPYLSHHDVNKIGYVVSSTPRDLHVSPMTTNTTPSTFHPQNSSFSRH